MWATSFLCRSTPAIVERQCEQVKVRATFSWVLYVSGSNSEHYERVIGMMHALYRGFGASYHVSRLIARTHTQYIHTMYAIYRRTVYIYAIYNILQLGTVAACATVLNDSVICKACTSLLQSLHFSTQLHVLIAGSVQCLQAGPAARAS